MILKILLEILKLNFTSKNKKPSTPKESNPATKTEPKVVKEVVTFEMVSTSSGKYPDRVKSPDFTDDVKSNIKKLIPKVNALLSDLGIESVSVSSGFRTQASNASLKNASKKSAHMTGEALDLSDPKQEIGKKIMANTSLLKKHGLFLEDLSATPTWCHLDIKARSERPVNIFKI